MSSDGSNDRTGLLLTIKEDRRLRRLAILLAAQLPDNPEHARAALNYAMEHVAACGSPAPIVCPRQASCLEYHAAASRQQHVPHCRANEA